MADRLRTARPADAERLAEIDLESNRSPWSAASFAETLHRAHGFAARDEHGHIHGFVLFSIAADECEILTLAVEPRARRRGTGRALVAAVLDHAAQAGVRRCILEVRASNAAAQVLYAACGFTLDARRAGYYRDGDAREDALLMSRTLAGISS